jgi:hypothetical protein
MSQMELIDDEHVVALMLKATGEDYWESDAWKLRMFADYMNAAVSLRVEPIYQVRDVHNMVWRDVGESTFYLMREKPEYKVRIVYAKQEGA